MYVIMYACILRSRP